MSSQKENILKIDQNMKSRKVSYIIYADLETLIKNKTICKSLQQRK